MTVTNNILCVEAGGTRFKWGFLPDQISTFAQLQAIQTGKLKSDADLMDKIPDIFSSTFPKNDLSEAMKQPKRKISISIKGAVSPDGNDYLSSGSCSLPRNLKQVLKEKSKCEVIDLANDAVCFARGSVEYLRLSSKSAPTPTLVITLGGGVGAAIINKDNTVSGVQISPLGVEFAEFKKTQISQESVYEKKQPCENWDIHTMFGEKFFTWAQAQGEYCNEMTVVSNQRFESMIHDLCSHFKKTYDIDFQSIVVGGGNSRFITVSQADTRQVVCLTPTQLVADGVSPDIVQLLGCQSSAHFQPPTLYPSFEKIEAAWKLKQAARK